MSSPKVGKSPRAPVPNKIPNPQLIARYALGLGCHAYVALSMPQCAIAGTATPTPIPCFVSPHNRHTFSFFIGRPHCNKLNLTSSIPISTLHPGCHAYLLVSMPTQHHRSLN